MKRHSDRFVFTVLLALGCVGSLLPYCESVGAGTLPAPIIQADKLKDPQSIAEGARIFAPICGTGYCHGTGGSGGGAPRIRGKGLPADEIFKVIKNGVGGTAMPAFKSAYSEDQIWKLVAFVMSPPGAEGNATTQPVLSTPPSTPAPPPTVVNAPIVGDGQAGKNIFFDGAQPKSCQSCHAFDGIGASIGPDLSKVGTRAPKELFLSIVLPHDKVEARYASMRLTLADGDKLVGIVKRENESEIELYDLTELPAVLRTVQKKNVVKTELLNESPMPRDYASIYTIKQLLDLVTYLKSADTKSPIALKDLF